ncbi:MAG: ester cyclase, partial [Vicinamibacterales bacterium]
MAIEENKALARQFNEAVQLYFRTGDLSGLNAVVAPMLLHHGPGMPPDLAGLKQMLPAFRSAFPDVEITTEEVLADGDHVVDRVTA